MSQPYHDSDRERLRGYFLKPEVLKTVNPSQWGYHFGPIPNPNKDWDPDVIRIAREQTGGLPADVTCAQNAEAPNPMSKMSNKNIGGRITEEERNDGENAIIRHILMGGWRNAKYRNEPGHASTFIERTADSMEYLARIDREFAEKYGYRFHRESVEEEKGE
ncbi:hypothetical protein F5Y16DRAFT_399462 [Xylariaceae sp. FL0255]|nr:hypothetical protein F5Y16DRAFT_399462 [Xylariaceae sp. FL0255]